MNILYNLNVGHDPTKNTIFLAGPTLRTNTLGSWRREAIQYFREFGFDGNLIIPEPKDGLYAPDYSSFEQISWERKYLAIANIILFWVPRNIDNLPGFSTNIEFGEWFRSNKLIIGFPENTPKMNYFRYINANYNKTNICNTLSETIRAALDKLGRESKIWFTSDTHFSQQRHLTLSRRPFFSVEDMDMNLISNWNGLVYAQDTMYHLGDFGCEETLPTLSGKEIYILRGNYDTDDFLDRLMSFDQHNRVKVIENNYELLNMNLVHEPESSIHNKFNLYGHIHKLQMVKINGLNVGTDCHNFKPIDMDTILFYMMAITHNYDNNVFIDKLGP